MNIVLGLLLLCATPLLGAFLGRRILERRWLSSRTRVFLASTLAAGLCFWAYMYSPWFALIVALLALFVLREGRAYNVPSGMVVGSARPRVSDGATWGDVHRRDRNIVPWSRKSDLHEMQEGALGSLGSASGKRFEAYPPVVHRDRPKHARLVVDNGRVPPKGASAKRGQLRSVK
ncbi:MAG TPA: hypothetical protein PKZ32_19970 [Candidatus Melainabacteria bacterium]|nr:hypothetical protein [Candidatus Melainabacteria bacterium]